MRVTVVLALASTLVLAGAWACGSFDPSGEDAIDAGGDGPVATIDGDPTPPDGGGDAAIDDAEGGPRAVLASCPRPAGPTCELAGCEKRKLYQPPNPGAEFPFGIATDSAFVYWVSMSFAQAGDAPYDGRGTSKIMRVDRAGAFNGGKATVIADQQRNATPIVLIGGWVYWGAMSGTSALLRRAQRGCAASCQVQDLLLGQIGGAQIVELVALDGDTLLAANVDGAVYIVKITQSSAVTNGTVTSSDFPALAAVTGAGIVAGGITQSVQRVPVTASGGVKFGSVPDAGDSGLTIGMSPITTDCNDIYGWRKKGNLWKLPGDGGTATAFATGVGYDGVFAMAADETWIYLAAPNGGGAVGVRISTGMPSTIQSGNVHRIAVDDVGVYWDDHDQNSGGALWMMVK